MEILKATYKLLLALMFDLLLFFNIGANMIIGILNIIVCITLAIAFIVIYIIEIVKIKKQKQE